MLSRYTAHFAPTHAHSRTADCIKQWAQGSAALLAIQYSIDASQLRCSPQAAHCVHIPGCPPICALNRNLMLKYRTSTGQTSPPPKVLALACRCRCVDMARKCNCLSRAVSSAALPGRACPAESPGAASSAHAPSWGYLCAPPTNAASQHSTQPLPDVASGGRRVSPVPEGSYLHSWPRRLCAAPLDVLPQGVHSGRFS